MTDPHPRNVGLMAVTLVVGWGFVGFGIYALLHRHVVTRDFGIWFLGGLVVHDAIIAPLAFAAGWALRRVAPGRLLAPLQAGLIATAVVVLFLVPALFGPGKTPLNPSQLPHDYTQSLIIALAAIWLGALGYGIARRAK